MEIYDFIVIGGGCVSASRLTEDPNVTVALLEAGPDRRGFLADFTAAGSAVLATKKNESNYAFDSVPQPGLNGRRCAATSAHLNHLALISQSLKIASGRRTQVMPAYDSPATSGLGGVSQLLVSRQSG